MFKHLKNNFIQAFGITFVWLIILITLFLRPKSISLDYLWGLIAIAAILSLTFGVIYTYLWEYSTFKASINVIISTTLNAIASFTCLYLFSSEMFSIVLPFAPYIIALTLLGHIIGFYLYSKVENRKLAKEINISLATKE